MSWHREFVGFTRVDGVVHYLYEWRKDMSRVHWDTQCGIGWGHRDNTDASRRPPIARTKVLTCFECIVYEQKIRQKAANR